MIYPIHSFWTVSNEARNRTMVKKTAWRRFPRGILIRPTVLECRYSSRRKWIDTVWHSGSVIWPRSWALPRSAFPIKCPKDKANRRRQAKLIVCSPPTRPNTARLGTARRHGTAHGTGHGTGKQWCWYAFHISPPIASSPHGTGNHHNQTGCLHKNGFAVATTFKGFRLVQSRFNFIVAPPCAECPMLFLISFTGTVYRS